MADEDRIFHLEVLCGFREPERLATVIPGDEYSIANVYFQSFMSALSTRPRCSVCNRFHEEYYD